MGDMVQQFHKPAQLQTLPKGQLKQVADDFEGLPIKFMNATDINQVQ